MKYFSTRGEGIAMTAAQAITKGIAADGGLFVPDTPVRFSQEQLDALISADYRTRAKTVLAPFLADFTDEEVAACVEGAYTAEKFGSDAIAPVHTIDDTTHVLELFHGPTSAFKDMALQILPFFMTTSAKKCGGDQTIRILVATSGDTGKAALEGFADVPGTEIMVFYPSDGVSDIQKLQMMTQSGKNVAVCGIHGNFDDAQTGVKNIFGNPEIVAALEEQNITFSSANSINIGRLIPQIVYYVSAWCDLRAAGKLQAGESFHVVVPTGNFGNILAASYAKAMGVPIGKLICASNQNNILTDFIRTGVYDRNRPFFTTESPSMDILISSNLERYLHSISGAEQTKARMQQLRETGRYEVTAAEKAVITEQFYGGCCDFEGTRKTIAKAFHEKQYLLDPHTAVAVSVLDAYRAETGDCTQAVVASTASPYKFADSVLAALGESAVGFEAIERLHALSGVPVPAPIASLRTKTPLHRRVCEVCEMPQVVLEGCHGGENA